MLVFHIQNGLYNSFFFTDDGVKNVQYYATEEDYDQGRSEQRSLEYSGNTHDSLHKYYIFIGGHALKIGDMVILLSPYTDEEQNRLTGILKDAIDVTFHMTNYNMLLPYTERYGFTVEVYDLEGNKINVYSSSNGTPFLKRVDDEGYNHLPREIVTPTSGPLKDIRCMTYNWSSSTFIKSTPSFTSTQNTIAWTFLSSLRPLILVVKPKKPRFNSVLYNNLIFKNNQEAYSNAYYVRW